MEVRPPEVLHRLTKCRLFGTTVAAGERRLPFEFFHAQQVNEDTVIVSIIQNKRPLTLETDARMFPDDGFVTQLRLAAEAGKK
jgi:hypothetical protein